jgi:hypothetical protein
MKFANFVKKNGLALLIVAVAVGLVVYMTKREGFGTAKCSTRAKCITQNRLNEWVNNKCYKPCSSPNKGWLNSANNQSCVNPKNRSQVVPRVEVTSC